MPQNYHSFYLGFVFTYVGIRGAGKACPWGLPGGIGGAPPPGLFGIAGACLPVAGGGGGTRVLPNEPGSLKKILNEISI